MLNLTRQSVCVLESLVLSFCYTCSCVNFHYNMYIHLIVTWDVYCIYARHYIILLNTSIKILYTYFQAVKRVE